MLRRTRRNLYYAVACALSVSLAEWTMPGQANATPTDEHATDGAGKLEEESYNCGWPLAHWYRAIESILHDVGQLWPSAEVTLEDGSSMRVWRSEVSVVEYYSCIHEGACELPQKISVRPAGASKSLCSWLGDPSVPAHRRGLPMNCISASAAQTYCQWRGGRLPTVEEWLAILEAQLCGSRFPWGDEWADHERLAVDVGVMAAYTPVEDVTIRKTLGSEALYCSGSGWRWCELGGPQFVASYTKGRSADGLLNLLGNVAEYAIAEDGSPRALGLSWSGDSRTLKQRPHMVNVPDYGDWETPGGRREILTEPSSELSNGPSPYVGFRCVWPKSPELRRFDVPATESRMLGNQQ